MIELIFLYNVQTHLHVIELIFPAHSFCGLFSIVLIQKKKFNQLNSLVVRGTQYIMVMASQQGLENESPSGDATPNSDTVVASESHNAVAADSAAPTSDTPSMVLAPGLSSSSTGGSNECKEDINKIPLVSMNLALPPIYATLYMDIRSENNVLRIKSRIKFKLGMLFAFCPPR